MKPVAYVLIPYKIAVLQMVCSEPFSGSFSTGIACEQTDRICYAIELDEKYVDVGVKRYVEYVGSSDDVYLIRDGEKIKYKSFLKS